MYAGVHLLLAHEMLGEGGQEARNGCDFGAFFACSEGSTPQELLQANIYNEIAVPLKGGKWREASMVMLAHTLRGSASDEASSKASSRRSSPSEASASTKIATVDGARAVRSTTEVDADVEMSVAPPAHEPPAQSSSAASGVIGSLAAKIKGALSPAASDSETPAGPPRSQQPTSEALKA